MNNKYLLFAEGCHCYDKDQFQKAICKFTGAIEMGLHNNDVYEMRGICYYFCEQYERALSDVNKAININHNSFFAHNLRANILLSSTLYYNYVQPLKMNSATCFTFQGGTFNNETIKHLKSALSDAKTAIKNGGNNDSNVQTTLGNAYFLLEDYENSKKALDKALKIDKKNTSALILRSKLNYVLKNYQQAIKDANDYLLHYPNDTVAHDCRGRAFYQLKEYQQAIKDLDETIFLDPQNDFAYFYRGSCYYFLDNYEKAIDDFNKAIGINPDNAPAYDLKGRACWFTGDYQEAINSENISIMLCEENPTAYDFRGRAYYCLQNYENAVQDETIAIKSGNCSYSAYDCRGRAYFYLKRYKESLLDLKIAYDMNPDNQDLYNFLKKIYDLIHKNSILIEK